MNCTVEKKNKLFSRVFDILCIVSGSFFVGVYLPYFFWHTIKRHPADIAASLLVFFCVLIPFFFRKLLKRLLKKFYIPIKSVWCFAMCFYMISFLIFFCVINNHKDISHTETDKQEVVVVFGCQVRSDGALSAELYERIKTAAEVLKAHPNAICIGAGGQGSDEGMAEAEAIKKHLVEDYGIAEERILTEKESTSTAENVEFSLNVLKNAGYEKENCSFICVSSAFHTPRTKLLFSRAGVENCATVSAETPYKFLLFLYTVREYMSYVHLLIFG